jgi:hypothetical protein
MSQMKWKKLTPVYASDGVLEFSYVYSAITRDGSVIRCRIVGVRFLTVGCYQFPDLNNACVQRDLSIEMPKTG